MAVAVVAVGTGAAAYTGEWRPLPALAALVGALLLQVASNLANDLFDFRKGADGPDRLGPTRAVAAGLLSEQQVVRGLCLVLVMALVTGLYLTWVGGWIILAIGLSGMLSAVLYTGGPWPLGYHGLGDLFVFLFFGLAAVAGTCYVQTGSWEPLAFWLGTALGCLAAAVLTVNNVRDLETDRRAGKRTLPVRLGRPLARLYYGALVLGPYGLVGALVLRGMLPVLSLLCLLTLPLAARLVVVVSTRSDGPSLNGALGKTALLLFLFGLLLLPSLA